MMVAIWGIALAIGAIILAQMRGEGIAVAAFGGATIFAWWVMASVEFENDRLDAENEGLRMAIEDVRADNERMREAVGAAKVACSNTIAECHKVMAENQRLRQDLAEARDAACESEEEIW